MDRLEFENKFRSASTKLDQKYEDEVLINSLSPVSKDKFKGFTNLIIVNEELSECQHEVSKYLRGKGNLTSLLEETADALISIRYIQLICGISDYDLNKAVNVKLDRQNKRNLKKDDIR